LNFLIFSIYKIFIKTENHAVKINDSFDKKPVMESFNATHFRALKG